MAYDNQPEKVGGNHKEEVWQTGGQHHAAEDNNDKPTTNYL
jgi:hypothetical protein